MCKLLSLLFNSKEYRVELPTNKRCKILNIATEYLSKSECKIRDFAQCIGIFGSACPATKYGWLYTKSIKREKCLALQKIGSYDKNMRINSGAKLELDWWKRNMMSINNPIRNYVYQLEIFSDASLKEWGACCADKRYHGQN